MSTNRLLLYLGNGCSCRRAERQSDRWRDVADHIETVIGENLVQVVYPGTSAFFGDTDKEICLQFWMHEDSQPTPAYSLHDASEHIAGELRRVSGLLSDAADRLDFGRGVSP